MAKKAAKKIAKKGAPKGNRNASRSETLSGAFPRFRDKQETVDAVEAQCEERKTNVANWLREAVQEKLSGSTLPASKPKPTKSVTSKSGITLVVGKDESGSRLHLLKKGGRSLHSIDILKAHKDQKKAVNQAKQWAEETLGHGDFVVSEE